MIAVTLYSREDCHLCKQVRAELESLQADIPHQLIIVDIDSDPKLQKLYGFNVPVVTVGPYRMAAPITRQDLIITLKAAQLSDDQDNLVTNSIESNKQLVKIPWSKSDQFTEWISRHYLGIFNVFISIYLGVAFLAPVMMRLGATTPATLIYRVYGAMCHELAFRSWFLFGEQAAYPRSQAGVNDLIDYSSATGLDENDLWEARAFVGNEFIGYKVALCQRDVAIYAGLQLFSLLFMATRRRLHSLHWAIWLLVGIVPIGVDGLSQLVSQIPLFQMIPLRESTPFLRTLTGLLFGFSTAWFGYPLVEETMRETQEYLKSKKRRLENHLNQAGNSVVQRGG